MSGRLIGVGVGPGRPDLLTLQALRVIETADAVFVPVSDDETGPGRAEAVVRAAAPGVALRPIRFSMAGPPDWRGAATTILEVTDTGAAAAFCTLGDPHVYSTFTHLRAAILALRPDLAIETVPGITAFQVLAAAAGRHLVDGHERLVLVPLLDGPAPLDDALPGADCVVLYKGGRHLRATLDRIAELGLDAIYGEQLGTPSERVVPAAEVDQPRGPYLSTVVVWK